MKEANYERHLSRVHSKSLEEIEGPAGREGGSMAKVLGLAVIAILLISIVAYYMVFMDEEPLGDGDTDGDGLPDQWEANNGFDHNDPADAARDSDGDGLTNLQEYHSNTDPRNGDTDGDGMSDSFELQYDFNPLSTNDANQDADMDGHTNLYEYAAGTDPRSSVMATISIQGYADIVVELFPDRAPITVENFIKYAQDGFYTGMEFHRVVDDFMIQGGGYNPGGVYKQPTYDPIALERTSQTGLTHKDGALSMARQTSPDTGTSQFFICDGDNGYRLDAENTGGDGYAVFGYTVSGLETVHALAEVPTIPGSNGGEGSEPVDTIFMNGVTITWVD